ncbi:hypothetical protein LINPERHAP1_LOCUS26054, partial [Linum perenne]
MVSLKKVKQRGTNTQTIGFVQLLIRAPTANQVLFEVDSERKRVNVPAKEFARCKAMFKNMNRCG